MRVSPNEDGAGYTSYRAVWGGKNAEGATHEWEWYASADRSTYTVTIPSGPVALSDDGPVTFGDFKVTGMVPVSPDSRAVMTVTVASGGETASWEKGMLTLRADSGSDTAIRTRVTNGAGVVSAGNPVVNVHEGDGRTTLTFSPPERADDPPLPISAGEYRATLTFHISAS